MPVDVHHSGPEAHRELAKKSLEDREILGQDCGINPGIRRALRLIRGVGGTWGRLSESDPTWAANGVARHRTRRGSTWVDHVRSEGHVTGTGVTWGFRGRGRTTRRAQSSGDGCDRYIVRADVRNRRDERTGAGHGSTTERTAGNDPPTNIPEDSPMLDAA